MSANTPKGFPYPLGTDRVADGDDAIRALAEAVDARASNSASGNVTIALNNAATGSAVVTFPAGRFTAAPAVVGTTGNASYFAVASTPSTTQVTLFAVQRAGTVVTASVLTYWIAREP